MNIVKSKELHQINKIEYYIKNSSARNNSINDVIVGESFLGQSTSLVGNDFIEYGSKLLIEKQQYNSDFLPNDYDKDSQLILGTNLYDIENLSKFIVPTLSNNLPTSESEIDRELGIKRYFGTTYLEGIRYYMVELCEGISKIVLINTEESGEYIDITFSNDEIPFDRVLYIFLIENNDSGNNEIKINLSRKSWVDDTINPLRNLKDYYLRNDELDKIIDYKNPIRIYKNLDTSKVIDITSGSILGLDSLIEKDKLPIYKNKSVNNSINLWSNTATYSLGDKVMMNDKVWVSLSDSNKNNYPLLSIYWDLIDNLTNYYEYRFTIDFKDDGFNINKGIISPNKSISFFNDINSLKITVDLIPGIELKKNTIDIYYRNGDKNSLYLGTDYIYKLSQDYENIIEFNKDVISEKLTSAEKLELDIEKIPYYLNLEFLELTNSGEYVVANEMDVINSFYIEILNKDTNNSIKYIYSNSVNTKVIEDIDINKLEITEGDKEFESESSEFYAITEEEDNPIQINEFNGDSLEAKFNKPETIKDVDDRIITYILDTLKIIKKDRNLLKINCLIDQEGKKVYPVDDNIIMDIIPNQVNEYNNIINYKILLTNDYNHIEFISDCNIILEYYELSILKLETEASIKFYIEDMTFTSIEEVKQYINITTDSISSINYEIEEIDNNIFQLNLSNINSDMKITISKNYQYENK